MPYCSHCGALAQDRDRFCANCGSAQPIINSAPGDQARDPLENLSPRTASILGYIPVIGWILAVIVLASRKFRANSVVRFHAFQGLYLFAVWLFIHWAVKPVFEDLHAPGYRVDRLLEAVMYGVWIFMMIKASHEERYVLPLIGDLAERSASES